MRAALPTREAQTSTQVQRAVTIKGPELLPVLPATTKFIPLYFSVLQMSQYLLLSRPGLEQVPPTLHGALRRAFHYFPSPSSPRHSSGPIPLSAEETHWCFDMQPPPRTPSRQQLHLSPRQQAAPSRRVVLACGPGRDHCPKCNLGLGSSLPASHQLELDEKSSDSPQVTAPPRLVPPIPSSILLELSPTSRMGTQGAGCTVQTQLTYVEWPMR